VAEGGWPTLPDSRKTRSCPTARGRAVLIGEELLKAMRRTVGWGTPGAHAVNWRWDRPPTARYPAAPLARGENRKNLPAPFIGGRYFLGNPFRALTWRNQDVGPSALTLLGCHGGDESVGPESVPEGLPAGVWYRRLCHARTLARLVRSLVFVGMTPGSAQAPSVLVRDQRGDPPWRWCRTAASIHPNRRGAGRSHFAVCRG
jgi:hypothetical protein